MPPVKITELKVNYYFELDLPGVRKKDIKINLVFNTLQIEGEWKSDKKVSRKNWVIQESFYGKFSRSFSLLKDVDTSET